MIPKILAWNTGRYYSAFGQRIGATQLKNGDVLMLDIDRCLEYRFAGIPFTRDAIMGAYDRNRGTYPYHMPEERAALELIRDAAGRLPGHYVPRAGS